MCRRTPGDCTSTRPHQAIDPYSLLSPKSFLGCCALVTHIINKSCTGRHEMLMGSLAGFHSGRDTESYSHELFTALELLCVVRCFSFCPQVTKLCAEARLERPLANISIYLTWNKKKELCPRYMASTVSIVWLLTCSLTVRSKVRIQPRNH